MINSAANVIKRRPSILIFVIILASITVFFEYNNPLISILIGLKASNEGYVLDALISFLKLIFNPAILVQTAIVMLFVIAIVSLLIGFFFSGYFSIILNAIKNKPKIRGEYYLGFKKLFTRVLTTSFLLLLSYIFFIIYLSVCAVPAVVITRAWLTGGNDYAILSIIIDLITAMIMFFSLMFFRAYTIFWMPAVAAGEKRFVHITKSLGKKHFWSIVEALLGFDLIFCIFNVLFIFARVKYSDTLICFILAGVFYTIFYLLLITYIFMSYVRFNEADYRIKSMENYY